MEAEKNRSTPLRNSNGATHSPLIAAPPPAEGPLLKKVSLRDRFRACSNSAFCRTTLCGAGCTGDGSPSAAQSPPFSGIRRARSFEHSGMIRRCASYVVASVVESFQAYSL
jgi:hypothetical protein